MHFSQEANVWKGIQYLNKFATVSNWTVRVTLGADLNCSGLLSCSAAVFVLFLLTTCRKRIAASEENTVSGTCDNTGTMRLSGLTRLHKHAFFLAYIPPTSSNICPLKRGKLSVCFRARYFLYCCCGSAAGCHALSRTECGELIPAISEPSFKRATTWNIFVSKRKALSRIKWNDGSEVSLCEVSKGNGTSPPNGKWEKIASFVFVSFCIVTDCRAYYSTNTTPSIIFLKWKSIEHFVSFLQMYVRDRMEDSGQLLHTFFDQSLARDFVWRQHLCGRNWEASSDRSTFRRVRSTTERRVPELDPPIRWWFHDSWR